MSNPLKMAHAGGMGYGRENSLTTVLEVLKHNPDIIELDIRKSRDGKLFCYHGPHIFGFFIAYLLKFLRFSTIKKLLKINSLEEIISGVKNPKIFFLDLKQRNITADDIEKVCSHSIHEIWLAGLSLKHLNKLKKSLSTKYKYIYNFGFLRLKNGIKKAKAYEVDCLQLFWWQCNQKNINTLRSRDLSHAVCIMFLSQKKYIELIKKYGSLWICKDNF